MEKARVEYVLFDLRRALWTWELGSSELALQIGALWTSYTIKDVDDDEMEWIGMPFGLQ